MTRYRVMACCLIFSAVSVSSLMAAGDATKGKAEFGQCSACHNADKDERKMGPGLKGLFKKDKMSDGKKLTDASIRAKIDDGGNGMPAYKELLTSQQKDDLM